MKFLLFLLPLILSIVYGQQIHPFWKVFCDQTPIYRGRLDTIVNPGVLSGHVHRVFGGNAFNPGDPARTPLEEYNILQTSTCTTCSITVDKTNYWVPDLYYKWPDGTFQLVPSAGLTVYYPTRVGNGNQSNPKYRAFPKGLRMIAGDPYRRTLNTSSHADMAVTFACIGVPGPETPYLPKDVSACVDGLRAQVGFPMCWNGRDLDSPDHKSHMSYPIEEYNNGDCPASHPVRLPFVFYEVSFSITGFPRQTTYQPFTWACGDDTGYGYHGDFLNGWDEDIVQAALQDPSCDAINTNNGNNVKACKTLAPYVQDPGSDKCQILRPYPNIEDLGLNHPITALPGCNPVTSGPNPAQPCTHITPQPISGPGWRRFLLQPKNNSNLFVGQANEYNLMTAKAVTPFYSEVWTMNQVPGGYTISSDLFGQYVTSPRGDPLICNKPSPSTWETFVFTQQAGGYYSITSLSNNYFISIHADGTLHADSPTVGDAQLWQLTDPRKFIPN